MTTRKKVSALTSHIGFWMRMVSNHVSYAFAHKLDSSGVTVAEWVVLREMYNIKGVTSPSHIAELTGLSRGAVSKLISRLFEKKLVARGEASKDRRFQDIELTPEAEKLLPHLASLADQNDAAFFSVLTQNERKDLTVLLKKITKSHNFTTLPID